MGMTITAEMNIWAPLSFLFQASVWQENIIPILVTWWADWDWVSDDGKLTVEGDFIYWLKTYDCKQSCDWLLFPRLPLSPPLSRVVPLAKTADNETFQLLSSFLCHGQFVSRAMLLLQDCSMWEIPLRAICMCKARTLLLPSGIHGMSWCDRCSVGMAQRPP